MGCRASGRLKKTYSTDEGVHGQNLTEHTLIIWPAVLAGRLYVKVYFVALAAINQASKGSEGRNGCSFAIMDESLKTGWPSVLSPFCGEARIPCRSHAGNQLLASIYWLMEAFDGASGVGEACVAFVEGKRRVNKPTFKPRGTELK